MLPVRHRHQIALPFGAFDARQVRHDIRAEHAWRHVAGLTIVNGFAARDIERREFASGIARAKSRDFATAVGPYLVSIDSLRDRVDTSSVMFARTLGPEQLNALKVNNVSCILVDMRLSQALPRLGVYFEVGESRLLHLAPPEPAALLKFNEEREVSRPFDNGYIIIYDVSALVRTLRNAH